MGKLDRPSIFMAILDMGLGHATRSLPILRFLADEGWNIWVGSSGRSLLFLRQEIPAARFIDLPDYGLSYTRKGVSLIHLFNSLPAAFQAISRERHITEKVVKENRIDLVLSDHRYGCYSKRIPSYFFAHQIRFVTPPALRPVEGAGFWFNRFFHRRFRRVLIPDVPAGGKGMISGRLSRVPRNDFYHFCGIFSSLRGEKKPEDIDIFISISGPEPQRTVFENKIRSQLNGLDGQIVVALGKPESKVLVRPADHIRIYDHIPRPQMQQLVNRSKLVITRSGYSTLMELAELGKKALLVPTPGQTEQIYLANRLQNAGYFSSVSQGALDLGRDIPRSLQYPGLPGIFRTTDSVQNLYDILQTALSGRETAVAHTG